MVLVSFSGFNILEFDYLVDEEISASCRRV